MGRVSKTGYSKAFEGTATDPNGILISDNNSIQKAIKGTISNESLATKNLQTLANIARLDMFSPKRSTIPIDTAAFRAFPKPTLTVNTVSKTAVENTVTNTYSIAIQLSCSINNMVGFNSKFTVTCSIQGVSNSTQSQLFFIPAKSTSFRHTSYTGTIDNFVELQWSDVSITSTEPIINVTLNYVSDDTSIGNGDVNEAYYTPSKTYSFNVPVQTANNNYTHIVQPITSLACGAGTSGIEQTKFSADQVIVNGSTIFNEDSLSTHLATGNYRLFSNGGEYVMYYNNGVQNLTTCSGGEGGEI